MSILSSKPEISSTPCPTIMSHDMESTKHSFGWTVPWIIIQGDVVQTI